MAARAFAELADPRAACQRRSHDCHNYRPLLHLHFHFNLHFLPSEVCKLRESACARDAGIDHDLILLLRVFALAGFIDAVVGGRGLSNSAMLILLPGAPVATILGTNNSPPVPEPRSRCSVTRMSRLIGRPFCRLRSLRSPSPSRIAHSHSPHTAFMRPIVLVLLVLVAIYVSLSKTSGSFTGPGTRRKKRHGSAF